MNRQNTKNRKEQGGKKWIIDGILDITQGQLIGEILPIGVTMSIAADVIDRVVYIANEDYKVMAIRESHVVAESTATDLFLQVEKLAAGEAPGEGVQLLDNNNENGIDLKGPANNVVIGDMPENGARELEPGERLAIDINGSGNEIEGVCVQIEMKRIEHQE